MKTTDSRGWFRKARVLALAVLTGASLMFGGMQSASAMAPTESVDLTSAVSAETASAETTPASSDSFEVGNPALASEPQLEVTGTVVVVAVDMKDSAHHQYLVTTDSGTVRIDGDLDGVTSGSTFTGTVALPASLTDRASSGFSAKIDDSAVNPITATGPEGAQLVKLAETETAPLQVVAGTVHLAQAAPIGTAAHTVDVAVLNGAVFSDATIDSNIASMRDYWISQSNGKITNFTRPSTVKRYTSTISNPCDATKLTPIWHEAAGKFGAANANRYFGLSGRHLIVVVDMPQTSTCGVGWGTIGNGTNGSGITWVNVSTDVDLHMITHEIGHNLGLGHSNSHRCTIAKDVECSTADLEYGDLYDIMGSGYSAYAGSTYVTTNKLPALNVTHKSLLGLFPTADLKQVTSNTPSLTLKPASAASGVRGVKVTDPFTNDVYYVEYRSGTGMDAGTFYTNNFVSSANMELRSLRAGVRILKIRPTANNSNASTVLAQRQQAGDPNKMYALKVGQKFTSASGGFSVTFPSMSGADAVIGINFTQTDRIAGNSRYSTAVEISKKAFPSPAGAPVVYVALGANYPDALSAAPAAVAEGGPLLLTEGHVLTSVVKAEIQRLHPTKIVVVGGEGVILPAVLNTLKTLISDPAKAIRVGGGDRYATGRLVVKQAFIDRPGASPSEPIAYIATGAGFPDALSASAAAGKIGAPVVLVNGSVSSVDAATKALLLELGVTQTRIAGGTGVVSAGVQTSLAGYTTVSRAAGTNRFNTNHLVNSVIFPSGAAEVYLATGFEFPDALAGAVLAGAKGAPLYLVNSTCVPAQTRSDIIDGGATKVTLIGGAGVLTSSVAKLKRC